MQQSNDSLSEEFMPGISLRTINQAECIVPNVSPKNEENLMGHVVYMLLPGADYVTSADRDEYRDFHFNISYPAEFEVEVDEIHIGGGAVLRPNEPLMLRASLCDPDGCYRADVPGIGTPLAAFSPKEMIDACSDLLAHLWEQYVLEEDANLKPRAQQIKTFLLRDYTVVR